MKYSLVELAPVAEGETTHDALHRAVRAAHEALTPGRVESVPDVWVLGSSGTSAELAGDLGLGYVFAGFLYKNGVRRTQYP